MDISLKCSCCGAPLDPETAENKVIVCPFCQTKNWIKELEIDKKDEDAIDIWYYPFDRTLQQFEQQCSQLLADDPLVPNDIFNEINFDKIRRVYISAWDFSGKYTYWFKYKEFGEEKYDMVSNSFLYYSSAYKGNLLSAEIIDRLAAFSFESEIEPEVIDLDELESDGYEIIHNNLRISSRQKDFKERLGAMVVEGRRPVNKKWTDIEITKCDLSIDGKEDPDDEIIYVPFHVAEFSYKGQEYFIMIDGFKGDTVLTKLPEDEERKTLLKKSFDGKYTTIGCIFFLLPVALWLLGFVGFWKAVLLYFVFGAIGGIIMAIGSSKDDNKKKEIIDQARQERNRMKPV